MIASNSLDCFSTCIIFQVIFKYLHQHNYFEVAMKIIGVSQLDQNYPNFHNESRKSSPSSRGRLVRKERKYKQRYMGGGYSVQYRETTYIYYSETRRGDGILYQKPKTQKKGKHREGKR